MNIVGKLNNTLGYLTAMSFYNTELSNQLVEPLNSLSEVISEVENSTIHSIVKSFPSKQELSKEIKNKLLEINKGKSVPSTKHDLGYSSGFIDCYDFMTK